MARLLLILSQEMTARKIFSIQTRRKQPAKGETMHHQIHNMLFFQKSSLEMIHAYLESEYACLLASFFTGDAGHAGIFSQDAARHAGHAGESRLALKRLLGERTIREYAAGCPVEINGRIIELAERIEELETKCLDQALTNRKLAQASEDAAAMHAGNAFGPSAAFGQTAMRIQ